MEKDITAMPITSVDFTYLINWPYLSILIISSILLLRLTKYGKTSSSPSSPEPPSPLSLPIIGHIYLLSPILPLSFQTLARRYGPLMRIRMGSSQSFLVASSPELARQILKTNDVNFSSRFELGPVQYTIYRGTEFITAPYSPYYKFMKKLCMTKLFAGSQLDRFKHIREHEIRACLSSLLESFARGNACDLTAELATLTNNLIFRMIMGRRYDRYANDEVKMIKELVMEIMELGAKCGVYEVFGPLKKYDLFGHGKKLRAAMVMYDDVLEKILKDYEDDQDGDRDDYDDDMMDILLKSLRDVDMEVKLTTNHIKHFILEMLFASIDTSSAALQWTMAQLINHPRVFKKLREEIESIVGPSHLMTECNIPNLPYLQAVVKESLRLHTSSPLIFRECTKDCIINGYNVKAGTRVFLNIHAIMRDPNTWQEPNEFLPERFLDWTREHDLGYLPFGSGRRACIGSSHALVLVQATVGALTQCFDWQVKGAEKVDINVGSGFSGAMARPLLCHPMLHFNPFE